MAQIQLPYYLIRLCFIDSESQPSLFITTFFLKWKLISKPYKLSSTKFISHISEGALKIFSTICDLVWVVSRRVWVCIIKASIVWDSRKRKWERNQRSRGCHCVKCLLLVLYGSPPFLFSTLFCVAQCSISDVVHVAVIAIC